LNYPEQRFLTRSTPRSFDAARFDQAFLSLFALLAGNNDGEGQSELPSRAKFATLAVNRVNAT
jgi:hypothetical protein